MKVLDLFCGLGGWSKGFAAEGFDVTGVDIVNVGYPYRFIQADIREFHAKGRYDIIVGSPPCRDFSMADRIGKYKWKKKPNYYEGLELVAHFLRVVSEVQPRYWLMENVPGLQKYIGEAKVKTRLHSTMQRCFWGDFPLFFIKMREGNFRMSKLTPSDKLHAWKRAEIPIAISTEFARRIKEVSE